MGDARQIWLITNDMSGSNDAPALEAIKQSCEGNALRVAWHTTFPHEDLPSPAMLDAAGAQMAVIFAGDGTLNAALDALEGWEGDVLVLPGGTMNLLYHRLFGDLEIEDAVAAACSGRAKRRQVSIISRDGEDAYAGLLAGPGTAWNTVREAMRKTAVVELASEAVAAIDETIGGDFVACEDPELGRREGYPLILLNPRDDGIEVLAYHAESAGEYLEQSWALMKRDFREGPHDELGSTEKVAIASTSGEPFGVLLDGEPGEDAPRMEFELVKAGVNLLATEADG